MIMSDQPERPHPDEQRSDEDVEVDEDPVTGSTKRAPAAEESGPPPAGRDPMTGEAPSG